VSRTILLTLACLFVVAVSIAGSANARDNRPQPELKSCRCVCGSHMSDAENWNYILRIEASEDCTLGPAQDCQVYNGETKKWEDGMTEVCVEPQLTQAKPRQPKKRFPRPRKSSDPLRAPDPLPRNPGGAQ
jgi:hypothetical protein